MRTPIKLNGVYYNLYGGRLPSQALANQMASKVGQGQSEYGDLTSWSAWIQEDWREGVGRIKPHRNGGFLYGEADTRVPGQIILSQAPTIYAMLRAADSDDNRWSHSPGKVAETGATAATTTISNSTTAIAIQVDSDNNGGINLSEIWLQFEASAGAVIDVYFCEETSGSPGAALFSKSKTVTQDFPGPHWHKFAISPEYQLPVSYDNYWLVVMVGSGSATFHGSTGWTITKCKSSSTSGASWTDTGFQFFYNFVATVDTSATTDVVPTRIAKIVYSSRPSGFVAVAETEITTTPCAELFEINSAGYTPPAGGSFVAQPYPPLDAAVFSGNIYVALSGSDIVYTSVGTVGISTLTGYEATLLHSFGGYLWRALDNEISYTADVSTWTDVGQVCSTPYMIRSMAGMEGSLYCACDDGLYRIAPGNFVEGIVPWPPSSENGRAIVNHQGSLYIALNNRVSRYTADGTLQDIWASREDDLPANRLGRVVALCSTDLWLVALVNGSSSSGRSSVWVYQEEGWHHLATLPTASGNTMYYDRNGSRLVVGTSNGQLIVVPMSSSAINPYNDSGSAYSRAAWIEWDWFDGTVLEAQKDYESVTLMGENLSANNTAKVYWKDDDSTGWELLGTVDSNNEELRWTLASGTRPNTKRLKLGILLTAATHTSTPRIRAIRVKYHLMVRDWFRWNMQIDVSGRTGDLQMTGDGTRHTLTASQIKDNLDALCKQVAPFIYQDVDGTQYEVKVVDGSFQYTKWEYIEDPNTEWWEGVYNLTVEQIRPDAYA